MDHLAIASLKEILVFPKQIVITSHRNPDGDAIGSSLALSLYLQSKSHQVTVIVPSEYPVYFEWMPQRELIKIMDMSGKECDEIMARAEIIFCLDYNSLERVDKMAPPIMRSNVPKVMVDHHIDPEPFADIQFSDTSFSSTSEMIFEILEALDPKAILNKDIRDCLYTGIMTDTGSFHHNTSARLFKTVARLKEAGLDDTKIQELVNNQMPDKYLKLLGHCLHNRMELIPEWNCGLMYLTREDYKQFDIVRGDTEGIVNYMMMLKSVQIAVLVMEQPTIVKFSMRSKDDFSVQKIMADNFNGGGHRNAAGGYAKTSLKDAIKKLKEVMPNYIFAAQ